MSVSTALAKKIQFDLFIPVIHRKKFHEIILPLINSKILTLLFYLMEVEKFNKDTFNSHIFIFKLWS